MKNLIIFISGNGSNLQTIIDACQKQAIAAKISAVFSENPNAYGLLRAKKAKIPTIVMQKNNYANNNIYDESLINKIVVYKPDLIILAGYMHIFTPLFINHYLGKIINIHPSLLPKYSGLHTHQKALTNNDKEHGASIHFVTEKLDAGPIILQKKVPIFATDKIQDIITRVQIQEHHMYPLVINWFINGRLIMINDSVFLDGHKLPKYGYDNNEY